MAKTVIALYNEITTAHRVVEELTEAGFDRNNVSLVAQDANEEYAGYVDDGAGDGAAEGAGLGAVVGGLGGLLVGLGALAIPGIGPVVAAGPIVSAITGAAVGAATGGVLGALVDLGIPEEEAHYYAEGVRRGGTLVAARTNDNNAERAVAIMNRYNPVDIERSASAWREQGWSEFEHDADRYTDVNRDRDFHLHESDLDTSLDTDVDTTYRDRDLDVEDEVTLPVVEEELRVGKRAVRHGGVRVTTHVEEVPVEETVRLREEHVTVDRRPVNRSVDAADFDTLEEGTIEVTEMSEEAIIDKQARVIEEVVIRKDVDTRTQTVSDTVRRTDVDVEQMDTDVDVTYQGFETYDTTFRNHWQSNFRDRGYTYEQYTPAYHYGYNLATDQRYQGRSWNEVEPEARRYWEERNPNTWEDFKDSVRHAWDRVTS